MAGESSRETTASLIERARSGDEHARDTILQRYLPALTRWAHGRLPAGARDLADTDDVVQVTVLRALDRLGEFEHRRPGSFLAYLRQILKNQLRDHARRVTRKPPAESLPETLTDGGASPLEEAIGTQALERYERALERLDDNEREAVIMRIELGFKWDDVATAMGSPSGNAARMTVTRALEKLVEEMDAG